MNSQNEQISREEEEKIFAAAYSGTEVPAVKEDSSTKSDNATPVVELTTEDKGKETKESADVGSEKPEDQAPDWYKALPEEAKRALDQVANERDRAAEHARTQAGRLKKAEQEKKELEARLQNAKPRDTPAPVSDSEFDKLLSEISDADAGLAKAIRLASETAVARTRAEYEQQLETLKATQIAPMKESQHQNYLAEQARILDARAANWREIVTHPSWQEAIDDLPVTLQSLVNSPHADDITFLLKHHRNYVNERYPERPASQSTKGGDPTAEQVAKERAEKLRASVAPVAGGAAPKQTQETEAELLQKEFLRGYSTVPGYYNSKARS